MSNFEYNIVGAVVTKQPTFDDEGNIITDAELDERYHVNAIGDAPESWLPFEIDAPSKPYRVYAGAETRFFRWDSEQEFSNYIEDSEDE